MTMRSQQGLVDIPPPQPRNMDRPPRLNLVLSQEKGIFASAHPPSKPGGCT